MNKTTIERIQFSKNLILSEVDKKYRKEVERIQAQLLITPSREQLIQSELDIIDRILHSPKHISRNDCFFDIVKDQHKEWYFATGRFDYPLQYIRLVRYHYQRFLGGIINFIGEEINDKAKPIVDAIVFFKLEEWLRKQKEYKPPKKQMPRIPSSVLRRLHRKFNNYLWEDIPVTKFLKMFDPENTKQGRLEGKVKGYQILIAYLFKRVCMKLGLPSFTNLEPRVGSFDRANYDENHRPQKGEMYDAIEGFIEKLTTNRGLKM
jgi:hypothetical protein